MSISARGLSGSIVLGVAALGLAAAGLASAQQPKSQPAKPAADPAAYRPAAGAYQFNYDIDVLGTPVITLGVDLAVGQDSYDASAKIKTVGVANWLFSWTQEIKSQGAITTRDFVPAQHRMTCEYRGRQRSAAIDYNDGKVVNVKVEPKPREDEISDRQRDQTRDPISAVIGLIYAANQGGQRCGGRTQVYDGRRRYDIVITELPPPTGSTAAATATDKTLACEIEFQPIAGEFRRPRPDDATRKPRPNDRARVWMAPVESVKVMAPVRIEFEANIGTMTLTLREANYAVADSTQPRQPSLTR
jgi:hypothetical protein